MPSFTADIFSFLRQASNSFYGCHSPLNGVQRVSVSECQRTIFHPLLKCASTHSRDVYTLSTGIYFWGDPFVGHFGIEDSIASPRQQNSHRPSSMCLIDRQFKFEIISGQSASMASGPCPPRRILWKACFPLQWKALISINHPERRVHQFP